MKNLIIIGARGFGGKSTIFIWIVEGMIRN